jgi:hypothetical protein
VAYLGGKCVKCGYDKCVAAMEFHHRDPSMKDFAISGGGVTRSFEAIKVELDKCDLVCANCHREIHDQEPSKKGRPNVLWPTPEELTSWVTSESVAAIARRRNVSRITVRNWCRRLNVTLPAHGSRTDTIPG